MDRASKNHGVSKADGMITAYGKDNSDVTGSKSQERGTGKMGGSITNLSHSLSGSSANQKGS